MARKKSALQKHRDRIRARDRRWHIKTYKCCICGIECDTQIHHFKYDVEYDTVNFCEVCDLCHRRIHGLRIHPNDKKQKAFKSW